MSAPPHSAPLTSPISATPVPPATPPAETLHYPYPEIPEPGAVTMVAPGVLWIRLPLPFALNHINVWALDDVYEGRAGWTLVDTGLGDAATRQIWARLQGQSLGGRPILRVVATHYHPDHIGNAGWFETEYDAPLFISLGEFLTAYGVWEETASFGPMRTAEMFGRHGLDEPRRRAMIERGNVYRRGVPTLPGTYRRIMPFDELHLGGQQWRVIPGYGHSPEHVSLYCASAGILISGDMLLPRISTNVGVSAVNPYGDPLRLFLESIERFDDLPADTLVLPSHGLPFRGIPARLQQLRDHHRERLAELHAAAAPPQTAAELLTVLFRRPLDMQQLFFAMGETIAHLNHLYHQGSLDRLEDGDGLIRYVRTQQL